MRRIVMFNWLTADGYFAAVDGNLSWVVPDEEQARAAAESIGGVDTVLFGRRTYELFEKFWPHALDDDVSTTPDPHHPGRRSREHRVIAVALNEMTKLVFSRTLKDVTWRNSRLVRALDPRDIEIMKNQPGKDMIVFGSGSIVSQLARHGLVDEYQFVVSPVLIGNGRQMMSALDATTRLTLLESKPYAAGNVMLRYGRGQ